MFRAETFVKPMKRLFVANKDKEITQNYLSKKLGIAGNEVRWVIRELRFDIPIIPTATRTYIYTTTNKKLIEKYVKRLEARNKEIAIKKNIAKRLLK